MRRIKKIGLGIVAGIFGLLLIAYLIEACSGCRTTEKNGVTFNVGKTESHSNVSTASTTCSSDNSTFNLRHVVLVDENTHPLSRRISAVVAERLKDFPGVEQVEVAGSLTNLYDGTQAPDIFLRIDLIDLKGGFLDHDMKVAVTASLGNAPWQSNHSSQDDATPPVVQFNWNTTVDYEAQFTGIRSDRYGAVVADIAGEVLKGFSNEVQTLSVKFPPLPELPREFYGPYEPAGDLDVLKPLAAQRAGSYCGLLTHNETFWKFSTASDPVPQLRQLIIGLEAGGWKTLEASLTNTEDHYVSFHRDGEELEIFRGRREQVDFMFTEKRKETAMEFIAHYRKPFTRAEVEAVVEKLFTDQRPIEIVMPFQNLFSRSQRERFYAGLERMPVTSSRNALQLANHYWNGKDTNAAVAMLVRAKALTAALTDYTTVESDIAALGKKISPKKTLKLVVTSDTYRELGFQEVTNAMPAMEHEREAGQPVLLFIDGEHGPETLCLTIRPPQKGSCSWMMIDAREGSRFFMESSFALPLKGSWAQNFTLGKYVLKFSVLPATDGRRFKIAIQPGLSNPAGG